MQQAVERIAKAIDRSEAVMVFGDYDVDGTTSVALVSSYLQNHLDVVVPYIQNMRKAYEWADYVISRAGATTIAELMYFQKQALLVPYPYAKDNHQDENAQVLASEGFSMKEDQASLDETTLVRFFQRPILEPATLDMQQQLDVKWQHVVS